MTDEELLEKFNTWPLLRGHMQQLKERIQALNQEGARIQMHFKRLQNEYQDWDTRLHFLDQDIEQLELQFGGPRERVIEVMKNKKLVHTLPHSDVQYVPGSAKIDSTNGSVLDDIFGAAPEPENKPDTSTLLDDIFNLG